MSVAAHYDEDTRHGRIIIRPNQSWSWRANAWLLSSLALISVTAGTFWALLGFWPVLLFTSLEIAIVSACIYYCVRRTHNQEVLIFTPDYLTLERGIRNPTERHRYPRFFTRFHIEAPKHAWYLPRILVRNPDAEIEIGAALGREDKKALESELRQMVYQFR